MSCGCFSLLSVAMGVAIGVSLCVVGGLRLEACPAEPALPVWMIVAGAAMTVVNTVFMIVHLCCCRRRHHEVDLDGAGPRPHRPLYWLVCACAGGVLGVVVILLMLGILVAGTYWVVIVGKDVRTDKADGTDQKVCALEVLIFSAAVVLVSWVHYSVVVVCAARSVCNRRKADREQQHIYDAVPEE